MRKSLTRVEAERIVRRIVTSSEGMNARGERPHVSVYVLGAANVHMSTCDDPSSWPEMFSGIPLRDGAGRFNGFIATSSQYPNKGITIVQKAIAKKTKHRPLPPIDDTLALSLLRLCQTYAKAAPFTIFGTKTPLAGNVSKFPHMTNGLVMGGVHLSKEDHIKGHIVVLSKDVQKAIRLARIGAKAFNDLTAR